jgi:hypothetical protein
LAVPFLLTSLGIERFLKFYNRFKFHMHAVEVASGGLLIALGILLVMGRFTLISFPAISRSLKGAPLCALANSPNKRLRKLMAPTAKRRKRIQRDLRMRSFSAEIREVQVREKKSANPVLHRRHRRGHVIRRRSHARNNARNGGSPKGQLVGNLAPDFELPRSTANPSSSPTLRGKAVLLNFWATYCGPARSRCPGLSNCKKNTARKDSRSSAWPWTMPAPKTSLNSPKIWASITPS